MNILALACHVLICNCLTALRNPAIAATFSVPARRFLSCSPPKELRRQFDSDPGIKKTNSLWTIDFMGRNRKQINLEFIDIQFFNSICLNSISMENSLMLC